jgi:hypothetical protein
MIQPMRRAPLILLVSATGLAGVLLFADAINRSERAAAVITLFIAVAGVVSFMRLTPGRPFTVGSVYLLLFALFHVGTLPYVITGSTPDMLAREGGWFDSPFRAAAITGVALSMLAFMAGYAAVHSARQVVPPPALPAPEPAAPAQGHGLGILGMLLVAGGAAFWLAVIVAASGTAFVTQSYDAFLIRTGDAPLPLAYLSIGVGLGALGFSPNPLLRRWGLVALAIFAIPAFLIGLRGEVIFPAAAWLVAASRRRQFRLRAWHVLVLLACLATGSAVRQIRIVGFSPDRLGQVALNPLDGLLELGGSLRPLVEMQTWHANGEPFVGWGTYWAPVERILLGRILGLSVTPTSDDPRAFAATVLHNIGPIGGSPAAESFRSAGLLGIVVVLGLIGLLVGWLDARPVGSISGSAVGMIAYPLLVWVRNDFTPVIFGILVCLLIICAAKLLDSVLGAQRGRSALSAPSRPPVPAR